MLQVINKKNRYVLNAEIIVYKIKTIYNKFSRIYPQLINRCNKLHEKVL